MSYVFITRMTGKPPESERLDKNVYKDFPGYPKKKKKDITHKIRHDGTLDQKQSGLAYQGIPACL